MPYLASTDVASFLNVTLTTADAALVTTIIAAISAYLDAFTGRTWTNSANTDIVESFDGNTDTFFPSNIPISQVTSITIDGDPVASDDIKNYGNYLKLIYHANPGPQNVVITYRSSATALPADLKLALTMWVAQIFKSQSDGGKTVESFSAGSISVKYLTKDGIPSFVADVIESYRILNF